MLKEHEINEIRDILEVASNPLFFFDNDQDGLVSYLLFKRYYERGIGIAVKTSPMESEYSRRIAEFSPDCIVILDQPEISEEFFSELKQTNLPIIWIDHHDVDFSKIPSFIKYYNPVKNKELNEPVCSLVYSVTKNKKDSWLAVAGCIADRFFPEFYAEFIKDYPDLGIKSKDAFEIFYFSEIGKISQMLGAGLKDKTSNVVKMMKILSKVKSPYEVLEENKENSVFQERFKSLDLKMKKLMEKAKREINEEKVFLFKYSGETSMSADIANRLTYSYSDKIIIVAYLKGSRVNLSLRGKGVRNLILKVLKNFENSKGGGHEDAAGCQIDVDKLDDFVAKIKEIAE
jgi:single-stranded DNA-specific DHH superfamily exonuclease